MTVGLPFSPLKLTTATSCIPVTVRPGKPPTLASLQDPLTLETIDPGKMPLPDFEGGLPCIIFNMVQDGMLAQG
jgi:hypothetical protein